MKRKATKTYLVPDGATGQAVELTITDGATGQVIAVRDLRPKKSAKKAKSRVAITPC